MHETRFSDGTNIHITTCAEQAKVAGAKYFGIQYADKDGDSTTGACFYTKEEIWRMLKWQKRAGKNVTWVVNYSERESVRTRRAQDAIKMNWDSIWEEA